MKKLSKKELNEILGGAHLKPATPISVLELEEAAEVNGEVDFSFMLRGIDDATITAGEFCDIAVKAGVSPRSIYDVLRCVDNDAYYLCG